MSEHVPQERQAGTLSERGTPFGGNVGSLQLILWPLWTAAVLGRGYLEIRPTLLVASPVDLAGLVVHCTLVGVIGMVVITLVEMRLEPWRFLDDRDP